VYMGQVPEIKLMMMMMMMMMLLCAYGHDRLVHERYLSVRKYRKLLLLLSLLYLKQE